MIERKAELEPRPRYPFFVVVGPIGVGKTKLIDLMREEFELETRPESFEENPYLHAFYSGREAEVAFDSQTFFLSVDVLKRKRTLEDLYKSPVVEDQGVEGDAIIEQGQREMGWITPSHHKDYLRAYWVKINAPNIIHPDIIIALRASKEVVRKRVIERGRPMELTMMKRHPEYFDKVVEVFDRWIKRARRGYKLVEIDNERHNFVADTGARDFVLREIVDWSNYYIASENQMNGRGADGAKLILPEFLGRKASTQREIPPGTTWNTKRLRIS